MIDASLGTIFEREGEFRQVGGNSPVLLDGRDAVWMVLSGQVDIFFIGAEGDLSGVPRKYLFSVPEGRLLFGMDLDTGTGRPLRAVGLPGTRMAKLDMDRLMGLSPGQAAHRELVSGIDAWIRGLSERLTRDIVPAPFPDRTIKPGSELDVAGDVVLSPAGAVVWIRFQKGGGYFLGSEELSADTLDTVFPLSDRAAWMVNSGDTVLTAAGTAEVLSAGMIRQGLAVFHERALQVLQLNIRLQAVDRYNFLKEKISVDRAVRQAGLTELAFTLERMPPHVCPEDLCRPHLERLCAGL